MTEKENLETHSFRAEADTVEYLDWLINQKNSNLPPGASDQEVTRSDILRDCIDEAIEELEDEVDAGNSTVGPIAAD